MSGTYYYYIIFFPYIRHNFPPTCPRNGRHCTTFTLFTHAEAFKYLICKVIFYFFTNNIS